MNAYSEASRVVLIVEDDSLIRDFEVAVLKRAGFEVLAAEDGIEGGAVFARNFQDIDVLVTDIAMPGMDGLKLASFARNIRPDLRVLFASGSINECERNIVEDVAGCALLAKPFTSEELLVAVERLFACGDPQNVRSFEELFHRSPA